MTQPTSYHVTTPDGTGFVDAGSADMRPSPEGEFPETLKAKDPSIYTGLIGVCGVKYYESHMEVQNDGKERERITCVLECKRIPYGEAFQMWCPSPGLAKKFKAHFDNPGNPALSGRFYLRPKMPPDGIKLNGWAFLGATEQVLGYDTPAQEVGVDQLPFEATAPK